MFSTEEKLLPAVVLSDPRSEIEFWMSGRGPNTPHRSTAPPAAGSPPPMSTLLLEELTSELVLPNQPLHKHTCANWTRLEFECFSYITKLKLDFDLRIQTLSMCVPAWLFRWAVRSVGWSRLSRGALFFSGLHALNLQLLNNNNKKTSKTNYSFLRSWIRAMHVW